MDRWYICDSQKCSLLLIVTSWESANDWRANGAVLIGQGRWKEEELSALLDARFPECSLEERTGMLRIAGWRHTPSNARNGATASARSKGRRAMWGDKRLQIE